MEQTDHDLIFWDQDAADMDDGLGWSFAPDDSGCFYRFRTEAEAQACADDWIANRTPDPLQGDPDELHERMGDR